MKFQHTAKLTSPSMQQPFKIAIGITYNFASVHLQAALLHAQQARGIEPDVHKAKTLINQEAAARYYASTISSLISSFCFIEAAINHLIFDISRVPQLEQFKVLDPLHTDCISKLYKQDVLETDTLNRYQLTLAIFQKTIFDCGAEPYQSVAKLNVIRNSLVHYKPIQVDFDAGSQKKLERQLKSDSIAPVPWIGDVFPKQHLSADRADWAISSARKFYADFAKRLGIPNPYASLAI